MSSVNRVFIIGRVGANPELRYTPAGKAFCKFSVATDRWAGPGQEPTTDWHSVIAWERQAETCGKYLTKGRQVAVVGRIRYDTYTDKKGAKKHWTEIRANEVTFLGSKPDSGSTSDGQAIAGGYGYGGGPATVAPLGPLKPLVTGHTSPPALPQPLNAVQGPDDDLPF